MPIDTLIDKVDTFEMVRDQIAAILVTEVASQQALAIADSKDPADWTLRVFMERSNPWQEFLDSPAQEDGPPIVNVAYDTGAFPERSSNVVDRQHSQATYHLDCYGYGISKDDAAGGHIPGDLKASLETQRAVRLVRNIIMSSTYTYLGLPRGTVWKRFVPSIRMHQTPIDERTVQKVTAARISLVVDFNEFAPQYTPEILESVAVTVKRSETGEVYLLADYPSTP